jgi:hypothetical protein
MLFWLRWLLLAGLVLLALLAEDLILSEAELKPGRLWIGLGFGASGNLLVGLMAFAAFDERVSRLFSALLDSTLAALFFWA